MKQPIKKSIVKAIARYLQKSIAQQDATQRGVCGLDLDQYAKRADKALARMSEVTWREGLRVERAYDSNPFAPDMIVYDLQCKAIARYTTNQLMEVLR